MSCWRMRLTTPANTQILFQTPIAERWREAARSMVWTSTT